MCIRGLFVHFFKIEYKIKWEVSFAFLILSLQSVKINSISISCFYFLLCGNWWYLSNLLLLKIMIIPISFTATWDNYKSPWKLTEKITIATLDTDKDTVSPWLLPEICVALWGTCPWVWVGGRWRGGWWGGGAGSRGTAGRTPTGSD